MRRFGRAPATEVPRVAVGGICIILSAHLWAAGPPARAGAQLLFSEQPDKKDTGSGPSAPNPVLTSPDTALSRRPNIAPGLLQLEAVVLHHLSPCHDEVIDKLLVRIIGSIDFRNGTQLRV